MQDFIYEHLRTQGDVMRAIVFTYESLNLFWRPKSAELKVINGFWIPNMYLPDILVLKTFLCNSKDYHKERVENTAFYSTQNEYISLQLFAQNAGRHRVHVEKVGFSWYSKASIN